MLTFIKNHRVSAALTFSVFAIFLFSAHTTFAASTYQFVPLSGFPAFNSVGSANGMSGFINDLYKYLIGIGAVLAVIEIIWGGFLWMGSGASVSSKEAGRRKIIMALAGLLLLLSPVIIFGLINPSVYSLQLDASNIPSNSNTINNVSPMAQGGSGAPNCKEVGTIFKKYTCTITGNQSTVNAALSAWVTNNCSSAVDATYSPVVNNQEYVSCPVHSNPFVMIDLNSNHWYHLGHNYQPLAADNGAAVINYANTCIQEGGEICVGASTGSATCPTGLSSQYSGYSCGKVSLTCVSPNNTVIAGMSGCGTNQPFQTPIQ